MLLYPSQFIMLLMTWRGGEEALLDSSFVLFLIANETTQKNRRVILSLEARDSQFKEKRDEFRFRWNNSPPISNCYWLFNPLCSSSVSFPFSAPAKKDWLLPHGLPSSPLVLSCPMVNLANLEFGYNFIPAVPNRLAGALPFVHDFLLRERHLIMT